MTENPGGSCEACKRKKCKCDRKLPSCSQCETSRSVCRYAESNKRGIPTGYLGLLEQRLSETEEALYRALTELTALKTRVNFSGSGDLRVHGLTSRELNTNKHGRMAEWREYPLKRPEELERWQQFIGANEIPLSGTQEKQLRIESEESYRAPPSIASNKQFTNENPLFGSLEMNPPPGFVRQSLPTHSPGDHIPLETPQSAEFPPHSPSREQTACYPHVFQPNFDRMGNMVNVLDNSSMIQQNITNDEWETGPSSGKNQDKFQQNPPLKQSERLSSAFQHTYY